MTGTDATARLAADLQPAAVVRWFRAPGRVNLVGDHTDYNEGFVLPVAVDRACVLAVRDVGGRTARVRSLDTNEVVEVPADGTGDAAAPTSLFARLVGAVVAELARRGRPAVGLDAALASEIPIGAGLSSSAALEVATAVALADAAEWSPRLVELADACRVAEEVATGVPCGIMDQLASLAGRAGHALSIDCRSLATRPVPLPPELALLAVHSGVSRSLAESAYAERRSACERLARELGVAALRDASADQVADRPLGRHVVSENRRALEAVRLLEDGDLPALGRLLLESHRSLRDDFQVSTPELDVLVSELVQAGAWGARLTGAGFGGCVVAICDIDLGSRVAATATASYRALTGLEPQAFACRAVDGAGRLDRLRP